LSDLELIYSKTQWDRPSLGPGIMRDLPHKMQSDKSSIRIPHTYSLIALI
jgi:hypothetical protein